MVRFGGYSEEVRFGADLQVYDKIAFATKKTFTRAQCKALAQEAIARVRTANTCFQLDRAQMVKSNFFAKRPGPIRTPGSHLIPKGT